jgi:hypothetical protein
MTAVSRPLACLSAFAVVMFTLSSSSSADIPQLINYQGKVTDSGGAPVTDGTYAMRFSIYDVATGGTSIWYSGVVSVQVTGGIFNVLLGESPQPAITLPFDEDYWLSVWIDGDTQTPRQRLGSVGYSYMASGVVPGTAISGSVTTGTSAALTGINTSATGSTYGLHGQSFSTEGAGVRGDAFATSGPAYGVRGACQSTSGAGVYGSASASTGTTYGVYGWSTSPSGRGVYGAASATTGTNYGVYGIAISPSGYAGYFDGNAKVTGDFTVDGSVSGPGIGDITQVNAGSHLGGGGTSGNVTLYLDVPVTLQDSSGGHIIKGTNTSTTGAAYGVVGQTASTDGEAVHAWATASTGVTRAVYGEVASTEGTGVRGVASANTGFTRGVSGSSSSTDNGTGVYGSNSATTGTTYGVYGTASSPSGYGVYYSGGLAGTGTKSCVVKTSRGPTLMYCQESPENWFEDFGEGQLADGRAHIELDPLFLETVTIDEANPMHVFVQLHDPNCEGVAVDRGRTGFDVIELKNGTSAVSFSYRIVAKRKGFEAKRLDYCKAGESDSYLYPELREKELKELRE